ncbi:MAG: 3-dehydroquinate synthase [Balneolaceae bacterium]
MDEVSHFLSTYYSSEKLFIIIDEQVYKSHSSLIENSFGEGFKKVIKYVVPSGEKHKSIEQFSSIVDFILKNGLERSTPLLAIGGGVIGDLSGFVAASVLRGIPLIHVPTTLLAMVDSSIGGKTGVNHSTGKNLIGAFYQPKAVFADVNFLETLPKKEWINGLSEIIKYGMIEAPGILDELKTLTSNKTMASPEKWIPVIEKSAKIKVDIVSRDVKESGIREFLNFGHTFAHVIERKGDFTSFSHGEAVFAGMFGALAASNYNGADISKSNLLPFKPLYELNFNKMGNNVKELTELMLRDKKVKNRTIRLVLLEEMGKPVVNSFEDIQFVEQSWEYLISEFS